MTSRYLDVTRAITPLRLIFWGGVLCVLDFTFTFSQKVNGEGFKFDLLNDFIGMLMIAFGVFALGRIEAHDRYATAMGFVKLIAVLATIEALHDHLIYSIPSGLSVFFMLLALAELVAIVVFCVAMRWLSNEAGLENAARSWTTTIWLFTLIYLLPLGLFYAAALVAFLTGTSFNINLGPAGLLLLPVFLVPLVHLFVSTSRMRREAEMPAVEAAY
jgi:hypothetical protein